MSENLYTVGCLSVALSGVSLVSVLCKDTEYVCK